MAEEPRAFVVMPGQGRLLDLGGFEMRVKADGGNTDGVVSVLEATEPPGFGPPIHVHHDAAEAFYVLEGEYVMHLDGEEFRCPAGSFIFIPLGVPHGFRVGDLPMLFAMPNRVVRRTRRARPERAARRSLPRPACRRAP